MLLQTGTQHNLIDKVLLWFHKRFTVLQKTGIVGLCCLFYGAVLLLFSTSLGTTVNNLVLIPIIAGAAAFGFLGGVTAGILVSPLQYLLLQFSGQSASVTSFMNHWISSILVGFILGFFSGFIKSFRMRY